MPRKSFKYLLIQHSISPNINKHDIISLPSFVDELNCSHNAIQHILHQLNTSVMCKYQILKHIYNKGFLRLET